MPTLQPPDERKIERIDFRPRQSVTLSGGRGNSL